MPRIIPSSDLPSGRLRTKVLIVGAGPLGISASIELSRAGVEHLLVESGGEAPGDAQELCGGLVTGGRYPDLVETRIRALGGTSHVWGGHSHPLRPIDFQPRPWLGLKGWPIAYEEFRPWFGHAAPLFGIRDEWEAKSVRNTPDQLAAMKVPFFTLEAFRISPRSGSGVPPPGDFWSINGAQVKGDVITHLTARSLEFDDGGTVAATHFSGPDGRRFSVEARHVILAMGGLETARFLLINQRRAPESPLSALGLIGKGFMEHPHPHLADALLFKPLPASFFRDRKANGSTSWLVFFADPETQEKYGLASFSFRLDPVSANAFSFGRDLLDVPMVGLFEQLPEDRRRVTLSETGTDALGDPLTVLNYFATHSEHEGINDSVDLAARALAVAGLGRVKLRMRRTSHDEPVDGLPWIGVGHHHMGTVRMGTSSADGVVDGDLRVFGVANLHLATTGIFPTCSCVNPTLNGAAFAMRLANRIGRILS